MKQIKTEEALKKFLNRDNNINMGKTLKIEVLEDYERKRPPFAILYLNS